MSKVLVDRELLPCPFCGQQEAFVEQLDSDASVVICQGMVDEHSACLARGPVGVQQSELEDQPGKDAAIAAWNDRAQPAEAEGVVAWAPSTALEKLRNRNNNAPCVLTDGPAEFNDVPLVPLAALSAVTAERDRLREDRDSQQRVCIASMEKVNQLRAEVEVEGMRKAFMRMRNVAAGYSNCCEFDSANTRRLEREFEAADELFRSSAAMAAKEA